MRDDLAFFGKPMLTLLSHLLLHMVRSFSKGLGVRFSKGQKRSRQAYNSLPFFFFFFTILSMVAPFAFLKASLISISFLIFQRRQLSTLARLSLPSRIFHQVTWTCMGQFLSEKPWPDPHAPLIVLLLELFPKHRGLVKAEANKALSIPALSVTKSSTPFSNRLHFACLTFFFATNGAPEALVVLDTFSRFHFQSSLGLLDIIPYKPQKWF